MRTLLRLILALVVVAFVGVLLLGLLPAGFSLRNGASTTTSSPSVGTNGTIDPAKARERAAEIGEKAAVATKKIQESVAEASITTKIKAKMALDDSLKARQIDVSTSGSTVTVSGQVPSPAARERALALARETAGVSVVVDHLIVTAP
jgi:hypothetical protein